MATKVKFFEMNSATASEEVTKFLEGVNVTQEGFLINNGILGIVYRDKDDIGAGEDQFILSISTELSKAQKQFVLQEGLSRAYGDMVTFYNGKKEIKMAEKNEKEAELAELKENNGIVIPENITGEVKKLTDKLADLKREFNSKKTREEKDKTLKKIQEVQTTFVPLQEEYKGYTTKYEQAIKKLEDELVFINSDIGDINGKIKENNGFKEASEQDRDQAKIFIISSKKMIEDIKAGLITKQIEE